MSLLLVLMMAVLMASCEDAQAKAKARRYYTNRDMFGVNMGIRTTRCRVYSYYLGKKISYGKKKEIGVVRNTTSKPVTKSLSITRATKRSFSLSLSASLPKEVLQSDIKATIGGSLSYDTSMTVAASGEVPARSTKSVYLQYKTVRARYKYIVQKQIKEKNKWRKYGKPYTKYNTSTTRVPVLVF